MSREGNLKMADEYRTTQYWGAGPEGRWYKQALESQKEDVRFRDSVMNFVRYAVRFTLENDKTLKNVPPSSPGEGS
jgi:hypothetical protein